MSPKQPEDSYRYLFEDSPASLWEQDLSTVKAHLDHLRESGIQDLRAYLEGHPEVVTQCARMVRVIDVNRATLELYQAESKAALQGDFGEVYGKVSGEAFKEQLVAISEGRTRLEMPTLSRTLAGEEKSVFLCWSVVPGYEETLGKVLVSIVNITSIKQAENTLLQRTLEMQARIEELDAFAHTVAHDLKNPLASIVGFAEFIEEHHNLLSAEQIHEYVRAIAQGGRRMTSIIQELLLLTSVRKAEIATMPLDMERIVIHASRRVIYMIKEHQAVIVTPDAWPLALGYPPWIEEVWVNYLSNALKYGGRPPRVELGASVQGSEVRFWVHDNGPGLTVEDQARLFEPFTRLGQLRVEGQGLGLSVVRYIVERLGGQVGVESEAGRGSTFYFTLPAGRDDGGEPPRLMS